MTCTVVAMIAGLACESRAETTEKLAPFVVTATRGASEPENSPVKITRFTAQELAAAPGLALDQVLRADAAFGLFRRTSSALAHPTAQGVSLRGIGPSGASRSLVLLDGVPLNDPFGGWVTWSKLPRLSLESVEIMRGGGSGAWGNGALGGTIALNSAPTVADRERRAVVELGEFSTQQAEISVATPTLRQGESLRISAREFSTDGPYTLAITDRGAIDRPLDSKHRWAQLDWRRAITDTVTAKFTARWFSEDRGNGTPLQRNRTRETFATLTVDGEPQPDSAWQAVAYAQSGELASYFTSVNATRTAETPANNQFAVPSTAAGAGFTWVHRTETSRTTAGGDFRAVRGETREEFSYAVDRFTRQRFAGGEQMVGGIFAHHDREFGSALRGSIDARVDHWQNRGGHRREAEIASGALVRDDRYGARTGLQFSPGVGVVWQPSKRAKVRGAAYRAFRQPTLNEYFRPFRAGNVSTEANPELVLETLTGIEAAAEFKIGALTVELGGFASELNDAVGNVTLSRTPTTISRQRQNLNRIEVRGVEVSADWKWGPDLSVSLDHLLNDARVANASAQPALVGRRLAQVPRHTLCVGANARLPCGVAVIAQLRRVSVQFEDDENLLPLAGVTTMDARVSRRIGRHADVALAVENIFDATVETSRSVDGLVTRDAGQWLRASLNLNW
ncbi:TonB-dependent receptor [Oleiharenicola lentus]|uniref:TonB-dependent receptor n=1 Tax=Oleiharenicola lentus TaxID=2508720 RepID=UPI003F671E4B